jgi:hypothetical protein
VAELDDVRVRNAMRSYLAACDALDASTGLGDGDGSREFLERAEAKTLSEMVLRQQLQRLGWSSPREVASADSAE